jgi:hypothetical protein
MNARYIAVREMRKGTHYPIVCSPNVVVEVEVDAAAGGRGLRL